MKNPMIETVEELTRICDELNKTYFEGKLPSPMITVQKTRKGNLGHCSTTKCWTPNDDTKPDDTNSFYEINFAAQSLDRTPVELAVVAQHELVHLDNIMKNISDVSGKLHNKKFKQTAEAHSLVCERDKKLGYGLTSATPEFEKFVTETLKPNMTKIHYFRQEPEKESKPKEPKVVYRVYCDECGKEFKYKPKKKDKNNFMEDFGFICKNCNSTMQIEEDEE